MTAIRLRATPEDKARDPYLEVPFEVPEGTTRIDIALRYPKAPDCVIDLGCADPRLGEFPAREGFRGWSGGAREAVFVATDAATPGYVAGPIPAGRWRVILGLYRLPPGGTEIEVEIGLDDAPRDPAPRPAPARAVREGAGWYRGDLHCHTHHSDAKGAPETLHANARRAGLDFLAVTDHNTVTQWDHFGPASSPDLVFLRGMEVTTEHGHANVFGLDGWVDFRLRAPGDAQALAREVHARGGMLSINHDKPDIPWRHDWPEADAMEVWQQHWLARNWISLGRWQDRLAAGMRLPLLGGSDRHQPEGLGPETMFELARPCTVLWAEELSEPALLAAMRAGRGYVTEAPDGPHLALRMGGAEMGGTATPDATVAIETDGAAGDLLSLWDATGEIARLPISGEGAELRPDVSPRGFLRAEIHAVAARERLLERFFADCRGGLPWGLSEAEIARQPLRRALSNPIWMKD
ncbi:CehA/McbA family metallohydrolase [Limimaricola pyoseonensis]|uniref:Predicted metal-dependent phosphoesterase TrpH, contains PHP domain n=1 Tax=Limimaricola pyoseonensis TaxID=521013 RepID=A0A1G7FR33_9RHOB|nr:CehA/McbA family metallohydrolase [Limimaricola pyoseonensis]SDE78350.1 Predicted metal-dependent phosphoesterase TrpH, contains PHP domain [Limimaricola pyoseonensis]